MGLRATTTTREDSAESRASACAIASGRGFCPGAPGQRSSAFGPPRRRPFPAASTILTDPDEYDLSSTQYAGLFLPQVLTAIAAALLGAGLSGRFGTRRVYLVGLAASLASMCVLLLSTLFVSEQETAYALLLVATACLGAGFGLTVPSLNTFVAAFFPAGIDRAVLSLNALLGLGTVLAPVLVAVFVGLGNWVGLPVLVAVLLLSLATLTITLTGNELTLDLSDPRILVAFSFIIGTSPWPLWRLIENSAKRLTSQFE